MRNSKNKNNAIECPTLGKINNNSIKCPALGWQNNNAMKLPTLGKNKQEQFKHLLFVLTFLFGVC